MAPEYQWNDYAQLDVRGKTVLVLAGDPGYRSKDPTLFKGAAMSAYGRWAYKIEEAARQGAAGVLLIHDAAASGYGWSAVENTWSGPQLELAASDNAARAAIEGWISADAAHALFALAGLDYEAQSAAAARPGFRASAMGLKVDAQLHNSIRRFNSANVIAVLPGAQRKHEYVIYTAHWDGLGRDAGGAVSERCGRRRHRGGGAADAGAILRPHPAAARPIDRVHRVHRRRSRGCSAPSTTSKTRCSR